MKVIAGLGNPGEQYARTPHNAGFMTIDVLAEQLGCKLKASWRFNARVGTAAHAGQDVLLVAPQTYMNDSGRAVGAILKYRRLSPGDLVVVLDDADIPLGTLRIRKQGGSAGHRGLASIVSVLGTDAFERIRIGIGRRGEGDLVEHVLTAFSRAEAETVNDVIRTAADAALYLVEHGVDAAMNRFNTRQNRPGNENETGAGGKA